jgi:hypothetical protein
MASMEECFNCLGKCEEISHILQKIVKGKKYELYFCCKNCYKAHLRDEPVLLKLINFIKKPEGMIDCLKGKNGVKITNLLTNAIETHTPKKMIQLYFNKYFENQVIVIEELSKLIETGIIKEVFYIKYCKMIKIIKDHEEAIIGGFSCD